LKKFNVIEESGLVILPKYKYQYLYIFISYTKIIDYKYYLLELKSTVKCLLKLDIAFIEKLSINGIGTYPFIKKLNEQSKCIKQITCNYIVGT